MNKKELFAKLKSDLETQLIFLEDKPEETVESTLKALWLKAAGISKSAEEALKSDLPELSKTHVSHLEDLIKQRLNNVPLAHITGRQNFMGFELLCDKRALIPRKETEILGKAALEVCELIAKSNDTPIVLDICCGSGNLGIALALSEPNIRIFSSDLSQEAVDLANENIKFHHLSNRVIAKQGNLFEAFNSDSFHGKVDLIICNPPYISTAKVSKMNSEISSNEPSLAFDGGMLGTKIIHLLINEAPKFLKQGGYLLFEVGLGQGNFIYELCKKTGFFNKVKTENDEMGKMRVIINIL